MNTLRARVKEIESSSKLSLSHFLCEDTVLSMVSLELPADLESGKAVTLGFNAMAVGIATVSSAKLSYSNQLTCTLKEIIKGEILSELLLSFYEQELSAIITTQSLSLLSLHTGDELIALIKANEIFVVEVDAC